MSKFIHKKLATHYLMYMYFERKHVGIRPSCSNKFTTLLKYHIPLKDGHDYKYKL